MADEGRLTQKFQLFERQIISIQQQMQAVEQAVIELSHLNLGLDEIKSGKEILAPVGRGIFAEARLISENLIVDIGEKKFVKKSVPEAKKLIIEQIKKLSEAREALEIEFEKINQELTKTFAEEKR